jgi:transcription termination factor NusB
MQKANTKESRQDEYRKTAIRYERKVLSAFLQKETKLDKLLHNDLRNLWIRACDSLEDLGRKITRLARRGK